MFRLFMLALQLPYFPAYKTHFFPEKCDLNSNCILYAEGKYLFPNLQIPVHLLVTHRVKTTVKMILVAMTTIFWVSIMNKLYYGC
jgi:hypothetical protein